MIVTLLNQSDSPGVFISVRQKHIRYYNSKCLLKVSADDPNAIEPDVATILRKLFLYTFFSTHVYNFNFIN